VPLTAAKVSAPGSFSFSWFFPLRRLRTMLPPQCAAAGSVPLLHRRISPFVLPLPLARISTLITFHVTADLPAFARAFTPPHTPSCKSRRFPAVLFCVCSPSIKALKLFSRLSPVSVFTFPSHIFLRGLWAGVDPSRSCRPVRNAFPLRPLYFRHFSLTPRVT